ncbi:hypothetical protein [Aureimonas phyllosphaerae]|uniref:Right handed beta helix region n=1 Tax=Aureimonas phyllosphaerae TaxID=1166078 RepID=A0A7W6BU43_9HYPH|nr:hypothetical protein [Aureimonas phyllosphaerae]MBB3938031.1 hypothetical protein [Aureimonas phyllosphaerae]MBB3962038.1 hypothetical protein [Aureimonas phyllosphaerae]SFF54127.1 hypothetical protein SAMN05216566_12438 [Aureimonas phyllosphaerae]
MKAGAIEFVGLAATLALTVCGTAEATEAPRSTFVESAILSEPSGDVQRLSSRDFTEYMERSVLDYGRTKAPAAFDGCPLPDPVSKGRTYVLDPVGGRLDGEGSAERPLPSLSAVFDAIRKGRLQMPLEAGDTLLLRSGDHGSVVVPDLGNDGFIAIRAAPGAAPVIETLRVTDAQNIVFEGLRFSSAGDGKNNRWLATVSPDASSIVFRSNRFSTRTDGASWSDEDWAQRSRMGLFSRGHCASVVGNRFDDLYNGFRSAGTSALVAGNRFEGVVNDNITFETGRQWLLGNAILNGRNSLSNPLHSDAIQGWNKDPDLASDVVIDGNLTLHYQPQRAEPPDPKRKVAGQWMTPESGVYRQGISIFDGKWSHVRVSGNVIVTNSTHALTMLGVEDSEITENVALSSDPTRVTARIRILYAKSRAPVERTVVEGNVVPQLEVTTRLPPHPNVILDELIQNTKGQPGETPVPPGPPAGWGGVLDRQQDVFVRDIDPAAGIYDVRPREPMHP